MTPWRLAVAGVGTMQNTIYVTGLSPEDTLSVREDFRRYPFPKWQLEVLEVGAELPLPLRAGQAILVVGCGGPLSGHYEPMWLLRLLVCGCPWVAVARRADRPTRELCQAAGAAAFLACPFTPPKLRELIWARAVPDAGRTPVLPLTCERLIRSLAVLGADVLLKFTEARGRTGFLALEDGKPFNAKVLDGAEGGAGLREILNWGKGHVLGQPLPVGLEANLPDRPEEWLRLLRARAAQAAQVFMPGGREACDRVVRDLDGVTACALVDLRSGQVVGSPSEGPPASEEAAEFVEAAAGLLLAPIRAFAADEVEEAVEEVIVLGRDGWYAASRLRVGAAALVVSATGQAHLGLARLAFEAAVLELERRSGMVVEDAEPGESEGPR